METLNISLPEQLSYQVDEIVKNEGFASRSEFFRTILRFYLSLTSSVRRKKELVFLPFKKAPLSDIKSQLIKSQSYNKKFITSVIAGLKRSSLYAHKTA